MKEIDDKWKIFNLVHKEGCMKTYKIVCPSCKGLGYIDEPRQISSSSKTVCPACSGSKTVMCAEADGGECTHDKVYSNNMLTSYPPQTEWICSKCGKQGVERSMVVTNTDTYDDIVKRFSGGKDENAK